jgi:hypothetical protein
MPIIRCESLDCLHNYDHKCAVTSNTIIDIDKNGVCVDNSPVTDVEYKNITGELRNRVESNCTSSQPTNQERGSVN